MKAHIVGGGFGGLAAAAYLIRDAGVPGQDITIYEADRQMGGGFFLGGTAATGYNLPGSVFDKEFRCAFDLLGTIPSAADPAVSVRDEFFSFNEQHLFHDRVHIIDRNGVVVHSRHYGLTLCDALGLARLALTPESWLDGRRIEEFFRPGFFDTEFWWLWSTIMGSLPQHSAAEFRRYMNRALALFPDLSDMTHILRTPFCQHQAFIEPVVAWLRPRGVNVLAGAFVRDIGFAPSSGRLTVDRIDYQQDGQAKSVAVAPDDIVLATLGSQVEDMSAGSMTAPPAPQTAGRSSALWRRLAQARSGFGNPELYFGPQRPSSRWVSFTVTTTGTEFIDQLSKLTQSEPGLGGLLTLKESSWVLSLTVFHQPEVVGQPTGTHVWWGYGLYPERNGDYVEKPMNACTGAEILEEVLRQLRFDEVDRIMGSSIAVPCDMPFVNNIWLPRGPTDRPQVVPEGATNLGLIGQYVEMPKDIAFTIEYSARSAWEAIHRLLKRGPAPPPVYQGQFDPKALWGALKVFLFK
ncbi:MAG TPA: oleate hydratase [Reyranella sp.]|nr:oleate hydratase [Reyranella sp.]